MKKSDEIKIQIHKNTKPANTIDIIKEKDWSIAFIYLEDGYCPKNAAGKPMPHGYPILHFENYIWIEEPNPYDEDGEEFGWWAVNGHPLIDLAFFFWFDIDLRE